MQEKVRPFVIKPLFRDLKSQQLKYLDVLTYVSLRSFNNPNNGCFPSYESIAERAGLSRTFVIESIKRLEKAKFINVYRTGFIAPNKSCVNHYSFRKEISFNSIPYDIFKVEELTPNEKAMLLLIVQSSFNYRDVWISLQKDAKGLGLTYNVYYKQFNSLIKKGFLEMKNKYVYKLKKIDWYFKEHHANIVFVDDKFLKADIEDDCFILT
jgi:hypothetical protein